MAAGNAAQTSKTNKDPLPRAWRWSVLVFPWALLLGGVSLATTGLLGFRSDTVSTAAIASGCGLAVAAAVLPRAKGSFGAAGVQGTLLGIDEFLEIVRTAATVAIPDDDPRREEKIYETVGRGFDLLAEAAMKEGLAYGHTSAGQTFTLTTVRNGEVQTVVVDPRELIQSAIAKSG